MADKNTIKNWFRTNLKPTQAQFWATWDSFWHKDEKIPITAIDNIENILADKADAEVLAHHLTDLTAHADLFDAKEDKTKRGAALGYAPLNEFTKLAIDYLNVVNDLVTGGESSLLTAEQGKLLQIQITAINTLLTSNDINLDTVQEFVNAIKTVQTSLSTILVNDLTTGGTTKAATAETVKVLKGLMDALTTFVGNKVDKVAGERLINAGEITKLAGLGNIVTTIKPILSTALASQNVAGMVTYINALTPVLVVGGSEIVKYNLTDTGRVFELNLRGRSFGVGQPAIVAADVLEVTDFLNKDIRFSNYPSTRNDGPLPSNRVAGFDINGNLKNYTIATAPAPFIKELIPDSYLPNTTGNIRVLGDFFTPQMCDRVNNPNAITIGGVTTIHYANFVNSQEILVNVTTGSAEGSFSITLNNGLETIKTNALLIVLGTVFKPETTDWINVVEPINFESGKVLTELYGSYGEAKWNKQFDITKNFMLTMNFALTPLGYTQNFNRKGYIYIKSVTDNSVLFMLECRTENGGFDLFEDTTMVVSSPTYNKPILKQIKIKYVGGIWTFFYNDALYYTSAINRNLIANTYLQFKVMEIDIENIKYIELAS